MLADRCAFAILGDASTWREHEAILNCTSSEDLLLSYVCKQINIRYHWGDEEHILGSYAVCVLFYTGFIYSGGIQP